MPPKKLDTAPIQELTRDQINRTFVNRFEDPELGANDKETGVFRAPDKNRRYLGPGEVQGAYVEALKGKGLKEFQARHLISYYLYDDFTKMDQLRRLRRSEQDKERQVEIDGERRAIHDQLLAMMRDVAADPKKYRINPEVPERPFKDLDTDPEHLWDRLIDDVKDPFHDNGQLPSPALVYDMCAGVFDKKFPGDKEEERLGKTLLKEHLVQSFRNSLQLLQSERKKGQRTTRQYYDNEFNILDKLRTALRDIVVRDGAAREYLLYIVQGEKPNDQVAELPTVEYRVPYGVTRIKDSDERKAAEEAAIKKIVSKYTPEERKRFVEDLMAGSRYAFYDEAGPINDERHLYEVMVMILQETGEYVPGDEESEQAFNTVFKALILDVVTEIASIKRQINELYRTRPTETVEQGDGTKKIVPVWSQQISQLKNQLGASRQKFLVATKAYIEDPALRAFAIEDDRDPYEVLSSVMVEEEVDDTIRFMCDEPENIDARMGSFDVFTELQNKELEEIRQTVSNAMYGEEEYVNFEREYRTAWQALKDVVTAENTTKEILDQAARRAESAYQDLVAYMIRYREENQLTSESK